MKKYFLIILLAFYMVNIFAEDMTKKITFKIGAVEEQNNDLIIPHADIKIIIGKDKDVENNIIHKITDGVLWAEKVTTSTKDKFKITHYYIKNPDEIDDKGVKIFYFDNIENSYIYYIAEADGYYPTFRKSFFASPAPAYPLGTFLPVALELAKKGPERIISRFPQEIKLSPHNNDKVDNEVIITIPEDSVIKATSCHIDALFSSAISMPLFFSSWIESPAVVIYPYDLKFEKSITVKTKPLRKMPKGYLALSVIRIIPGDIYASNISGANPVKYTKDGYIEFSINQGGMYYAISWQTDKK